jgi:methyl-accepting chemotaxis protein
MRMADGDLTEQTERRTGPPGRDELSQLVSAVQAMQDHLVNLVRTVQASAAGVASASSQIAQGNGDLSSRTERQAAGIEQTGATIAELSGTVEQNSRDTREADALARTAREVAAAGGTLMEGVVATMQGIQGGAQRIAEITGVIDGIAFQTNILALNAAVEAARAGAEGRGFAVVATEVRALAQRSAQAAREIKSLIAASVEQVGDGARQVGEAGETMTRIVASIGRVSELVGDIATSAQAQAEGLAQVRSAVQDIESATQQNAALVEESTAAAQSLHTQARKLSLAVGVFKVEDAPRQPG